ncbi:carnitine racemase/ catalytic [Iris pallida]|uniref:Delta(3)-Delta(2)-enoyl-CoA isomerase n=1 Tax=Iris pallida TaxID=29817 RepID=A0AAX6FFB1_IRIPA|nr:carnitine racemase/ catalytic [Iris pallida]
MCTVEKRGQIFILTLTGGDEHRLSLDLITRIRSALARIRTDALSSNSSSALVTVAEGKFFSNGFDLGFANAAATQAERAARLASMVDALAPLLADLLSLPMPTVAAVTGHAAAAGFMLALAHDYVAMRSDRGFLYMSELDLGLTLPAYFMTLMRGKIRDLGLFKKIVMKSGKVMAVEAMEKGVVDVVKGSAGETAAAAAAMAEGLAKRGWNGRVYASIRMGAFPEICRAVGLPEESEEDRRKMFASKL